MIAVSLNSFVQQEARVTGESLLFQTFKLFSNRAWIERYFYEQYYLIICVFNITEHCLFLNYV